MIRVRHALDRGWPAFLLAALALGLSVANWFPYSRAAGAVAGVAAIAASFALPAPVRLGLAAIALGAAGLWWGGMRLHELDRSLLAARIGQPAGAQVVVTGAASRSPFAVRVAAEVRRFDGVALRERVLLELPAGRAPPQGSVLELRARPVAPRGPETGFDERGWLERRGIHVVLHASGPWHVVGRRGGIGGVGDRLRTAIADALALGTSGERRSLVTGVVLGADEGLDPELRSAFKASGLYHLLAVSGQNIVFIGFGVIGLAYVLGLSRVVGHSLAIVAILAYALAVGWQPSVVRAAVAGCLASVAWLLSRPSDRWHTMAVGAVVLLAWTPRSLLEPGFQLSFAAVAAIFLVMPRLRPVYEGYPVPRWLVEIVGISTACGVVTAPILWLQFGTIPLWTVPANAIAEPAMPVLLGTGLAAAIVAPVFPPAAVALSWLAGAAGAWIAFSARLIASLPYAETSSRELVLALGGVVLALAALRAIPGYRRSAAVITAAALVPLGAVAWWAVNPPASWSPPAGLRVTFLDVGQGDGILLETPHGAMLIDAGPPEARVDDQLRRMGLHSLAALVTTHAHRDHVGGGSAVLRRLRVGQVIDPMQPGVGLDERELRRTARLRGVPLVPARVGDVYALGQLRVRVLWPDRAGSRGEDPHVHGTVLLVSYGSTDLLLTGDSESTVTRSLPLRQVDVLKVAHHGSSDEGFPDLLGTVRPRIAVISVGAHNDYDHPRADILAALNDRAGLAVYRTDEHGRVVLESDGTSMIVRTDRPVR